MLALKIRLELERNFTSNQSIIGGVTNRCRGRPDFTTLSLGLLLNKHNFLVAFKLKPLLFEYLLIKHQLIENLIDCN
jgi:hypothetical protein